MFSPILRLLLADIYDRMDSMSVELDNLKAAIAHDEDVTAKLISYLATVKTNLDTVSAQLAALQAQEVVNPADLQAIADAVNAHAADVATHLPAELAPAPVDAPAAPSA